MQEGLRFRRGRLGDERMKPDPDTIKSLIGQGYGYIPEDMIGKSGEIAISLNFAAEHA